MELHFSSILTYSALLIFLKLSTTSQNTNNMKSIKYNIKWRRHANGMQNHLLYYPLLYELFPYIVMYIYTTCLYLDVCLLEMARHQPSGMVWCGTYRISNFCDIEYSFVVLTQLYWNKQKIIMMMCVHKWHIGFFFTYFYLSSSSYICMYVFKWKEWRNKGFNWFILS